jgi:hypothetical protein
MHATTTRTTTSKSSLHNRLTLDLAGPGTATKITESDSLASLRKYQKIELD